MKDINNSMAAPIAVFEVATDPNGDEWPSEFIDYRSPTTMEDVLNSNGESFPVLSPKEEISIDNFSEMRSDSVEDLVNNFEEKLAVCFRNYNYNTENFAPVQILTQEELMKNSKLWQEVTEHMGQVMPLDWQNSKARQLHLPSLNLSKRRETDESLDLPEDEDLAQSLDMHSMILSGSTATPEDDEEYPVVTAEQVIEELDEMFQSESSPEEPVEEDRLSTISRELQALRERSLATSNYEEGNVGQGPQGLKEMDLVQLNELLEELENTVREYSEILIQQLALREEMDDEKETKNMFIAALLSVQNKIKNKNGKGKGKSSNAGGLAGLGLISRIKGKNGLVEPGIYLTTRIPYSKTVGSPDLETLRMLTKILRAIDVDSKEVPDLLTNYILKVLFPSGAEECQALPAPILSSR